MRPVFVFLLALAYISSAQAYTGPGLGLGIIGTVLGVVFSLLLAILAIFWYPLKRALKIGKRNAEADDDTAEEEPQPATENTTDPR
jgi:hypothetical protein|tara:strand:- start:3631 stop:3888 length:258 start_codon:yes stop_codon:yes gene_type:complete